MPKCKSCTRRKQPGNENAMHTCPKAWVGGRSRLEELDMSNFGCSYMHGNRTEERVRHIYREKNEVSLADVRRRKVTDGKLKDESGIIFTQRLLEVSVSGTKTRKRILGSNVVV
ncbi:hypothetical protein PIB30_052250 [Stylosanthes scabra]|uniref:Uncharacterized protein n=1 Tax=Stylosanthes scabra TaxID=79078 RepID=A0ABU6ULL4_9FABA|nr:hypothetical protein [Stylosanthes scabra]